MRPSSRDPAAAWIAAQHNPTYYGGALDDIEGQRIKWHSPSDQCSSQVFCVSAFGMLRRLPDGNCILDRLFADAALALPSGKQWTLRLEYVDRALLGETGQGTPTNVDVFCESGDAVVCIESKFKFDAYEGFGGCGQIAKGNCAGFYGIGSDLKRGSPARCRLEIKDGRRGPRAYWALGRRYFVEDVFQEQTAGLDCPFAGSNFQLMRNFLFAVGSAGGHRSFGVLAIVPEKTSMEIRDQVEAFRGEILREEYRRQIGIATYDELIALLVRSRHEQSRALGRFLNERISSLL